MAGWWFGTWLLLFHRLGIIIPTDFHIFQKGWNHQPDGFRDIQFQSNSVTTSQNGWLGPTWQSKMCASVPAVAPWLEDPSIDDIDWCRWFRWFSHIKNLLYIYIHITRGFQLPRLICLVPGIRSLFQRTELRDGFWRIGGYPSGSLFFPSSKKKGKAIKIWWESQFL